MTINITLQQIFQRIVQKVVIDHRIRIIIRCDEEEKLNLSFIVRASLTDAQTQMQTIEIALAVFDELIDALKHFLFVLPLTVEFSS